MATVLQYPKPNRREQNELIRDAYNTLANYLDGEEYHTEGYAQDQMYMLIVFATRVEAYGDVWQIKQDYDSKMFVLRRSTINYEEQP